MDYNKLGLDKSLVEAVKSITEASCSSKKMEKEELHPNQKKLDKNKNGKLDSDDFKMLRGEKSVKEETEELDEVMSQMQKLRDAHERHMQKALAANKAGNDEATKVHQKYMQKISDKMNKLKRNEEIELGEEVEQIDELSKATLANYTQKAAHDVGNKMYSASSRRSLAAYHDSKGNEYTAKNLGKEGDKAHSKALKRLQGIKTAAKKLTKEQYDEIEALAAKHGLTGE